MAKILACAGLLLVCFGCGKNYSGTFKGTESVDASGVKTTATITAVITEANGTVSGAWTSSTGGKGTISGTVKDDIIDPMTLEDTSSTCAGAYVGTAKLDSTGNTLSGYAAGTAGSCGEITAGFSLIRQ